MYYIENLRVYSYVKIYH